MDRITAIKAIARNLKDLVVDTIPATLSSTEVRANKLTHPIDNQLKGYPFYIYSGAGAGQARVVGTHTASLKCLVFAESFSSIPSTNSNFVLFSHWDKDEYDNALDRSIGWAKLRYLEGKVATMELAASQYEYATPSGFEYISGIRLVPSGSTDYGDSTDVRTQFEFHPRYYRIEPNAKGTYIIIFDRRLVNLDDFDEQMVNVVGQMKPDINATDNATIPEDLEEYVVAASSMLLSSQRMNENQEWRSKFYMFRDEVKGSKGMPGLEEYIHRSRYGKRIGG